MPQLNQMNPGDRFELEGKTGTLQMVNACRARVRMDGPNRVVHIPGKTPFVAQGGKIVSVTPRLQVRRLIEQ